MTSGANLGRKPSASVRFARSRRFLKAFTSKVSEPLLASATPDLPTADLVFALLLQPVNCVHRISYFSPIRAPLGSVTKRRTLLSGMLVWWPDEASHLLQR